MSVAALRQKLCDGTISLQCFLRSVRTHAKKKRQEEERKALYGVAATTKSCQVRKKVAFSYFFDHWQTPAPCSPCAAPVTVVPPAQFDDSPIQPEEVARALCGAKSAPGCDRVSFQDLRDTEAWWERKSSGTADPSMTDDAPPPSLPLLQRFQQAKDSGKPEDQWSKAIVSLIYKKGDPSDPANYRPISVLPTAARVFHKILAARLHRFLAKNLSPNQKGFRPGVEGTVEHSLSLQQEIATTPPGVPIYILLLDLKQAYDTVFHNYIWERLSTLGLPLWFQQYLQALYSKAMASICCQDGKTRPIPVRRGLLQGCPLSPPLWNMVFDPAISQDLYPPYLSLRAFADDVAMSSRCLLSIRAAIATFEAAIRPMGVSTNPTKCVVCKLVDGIPVPMDEEVYIGGLPCPTTADSDHPPKYLGMPLWNVDNFILSRFQTCLGNLSAADIPAGRKASILQRRFLPDHFFLLQHAFLLHDSTLGQLNHLVVNTYLGWRKWAPLSIRPGLLLVWLQSMVFYRLLTRDCDVSSRAAAAAAISTRLGNIYTMAAQLALCFPSKHTAGRVAKQLLLTDDSLVGPQEDYPEP